MHVLMQVGAQGCHEHHQRSTERIIFYRLCFSWRRTLKCKQNSLIKFLTAVGHRMLLYSSARRIGRRDGKRIKIIYLMISLMRVLLYHFECGIMPGIMHSDMSSDHIKVTANK